MSVPRERIGFTRAVWLVVGLTMATLPVAADLPAWEVIGIIAIAVWRLRVEARGIGGAPSMFKRAVLSVLVVAGLWLSGSLGYGLSAATPLFVAFLWIKLLELAGERDYVLAALLATFLVAVVLFGDGGLASCAWALLTLAVLIGALVRYRAGPLPAATARTTVNLSLQSIPLAALLFLAFPRINLPLPNLSSQAISGFTERLNPGDVSRMALSEQPVMRVEFPEGMPDGIERRYWRGVVLNETDGVVWTAFLASRFAPDRMLPEVATLPVVTQVVTIQPNNQRWLFALDLPETPPEGISRQPNRTLRSENRVNHVMRYTVRSRLDAPPTDLDQRAHLLPAHIDQRVRDLAASWRDAAGDDAAKLVATGLAWLHSNGFEYALDPGMMKDPVAEFLFERKRGFCSHYATSFALLLRLAGVPARVVAGYHGSEINPVGNFVVVRQSHAHAWCEVLVGDRWQRVDPTEGIPPAPGETSPAVQRAQGGAAAAAALGGRVPAWMPEWMQGPWRSSRHYWQFMDARWESWAMAYDADQQAGLLARLGFKMRGGLGWLAAGAVLLLLGTALVWLIWLVMRWRSRAPSPEPAVVLWTELCHRCAAAGCTREAWEGPRDFSERAAAEFPAQAVALRAAADAYIACRYASPVDPQAAISALTKAVARVRPARRARSSATSPSTSPPRPA